MIVHSGLSIPYQSAQDGEVYPLKSLQEHNSVLQALVDERTQELHESQALYRMLTEDAQDVLWKTDSRLVITYISPADERLRGFRADEVLGHSVFEMFTDEGVELVKGMLRRRAIEDAFETAKTEPGLDHNETRTWQGWHRHVSLIMPAFALLTVIRWRLAQRQIEPARGIAWSV